VPLRSEVNFFARFRDLAAHPVAGIHDRQWKPTVTTIALRLLAKQFGNTTAVDHVNLEIPPGCLFFLLGPSGCGKTTLLRMIAGFVKPTSGTIHFNDTNMTHAPANRRACGMVFQSYALWPHMTVRQNVAFGLDMQKTPPGEKRRRVGEALDRVQMTALAERKINQLSGGQQQRVALARALVIRPSVLLLDEPLSNLDARLRLDMRQTIRRICHDAGITSIYVTHDQKEAISMADQVAIMRGGRIEQVGTPRKLYTQPRDRFVAEFLGDTNLISATVLRQDAKNLLLQCKAGVLQARGGTDQDTASGKVTCSVRPECIRIRPGHDTRTDGAANGFEARVRGTVYLGDLAEHTVETVGGMVLKSYEVNPHLALEADQPVTVAFDPEDLVILSD